MVGKVKHLVNRAGRYHARLVAPKEMRDSVSKSELRKPLEGRLPPSPQTFARCGRAASTSDCRGKA